MLLLRESRFPCSRSLLDLLDLVEEPCLLLPPLLLLFRLLILSLSCDDSSVVGSSVLEVEEDDFLLRLVLLVPTLSAEELNEGCPTLFSSSPPRSVTRCFSLCSRGALNSVSKESDDRGSFLLLTLFGFGGPSESWRSLILLGGNGARSLSLPCGFSLSLLETDRRLDSSELPLLIVLSSSGDLVDLEIRRRLPTFFVRPLVDWG